MHFGHTSTTYELADLITAAENTGSVVYH